MAHAENRPVTVRTIAEHVGVSPSAVSTVLANRHEERRLAPATVEKIRQAVRELGYVPNVTARRLRARRGDAAHRVDDRAELGDALDATGKPGEAAVVRSRATQPAP